MNSLRKLVLSRPQRIFLWKRMYSKDLTEEENKKLYEKLADNSTFDEKKTEVSSLVKFVTPNLKEGPPRLLSYDWTMKSIYSWYKRKRTEFHKYNQRYIVERVKALGSDLAAAHFVVYRGGAVRFQGQDNFIRWADKKEEYCINLPETYDPKYFIEAIDISGLAIYYQGLENLKNLYKLKWLSLRNNPCLDNWCLDYIGYAIPNLEYLDISDCPLITANGIASLHKLTQLKELVVNSDNIEFQMACFALEDITPGLFVSILNKDDDSSKLHMKEEKLNINEV